MDSDRRRSDVTFRSRDTGYATVADLSEATRRRHVHSGEAAVSSEELQKHIDELDSRIAKMSTAKSTALRRELAAEFLSDASTDDRQLVEASGARDGVATSTTLKPGRQRPAGEQSTTDRKVATTMQRVTDASVVSKDRAPVTERPRLIVREPPSD